MQRYKIEEFINGVWEYYRGFSDLEQAINWFSVLRKNHENIHFRLIEVIKVE